MPNIDPFLVVVLFDNKNLVSALVVDDHKSKVIDIFFCCEKRVLKMAKMIKFDIVRKKSSLRV